MSTDEPRRILITGMAGVLAGRLAARLEADDRVEYVGGLDLSNPDRDLGRTEFIRTDLRNPLIAKVIEATRVDTVVHLHLASGPRGAGGRSRMKELNVIGTMQLLAAVQQAPRVRKVVVRSTTAVYGSDFNDPSLLREDTAPMTTVRRGYARDAVEVERYVSRCARARPDLTATLLRFASIIGPSVTSPLASYFALPVLPTVLGYDPRIQLCHEDDAVEVLCRSVLSDHGGATNVAGPGILYLSQAARLAGKVTIPVLPPVMSGLGPLVGRLAGVDFSPEQLAYLRFGRVGDITRLRTELGFTPAYSTRAAFQDYLRRRPGPRLPGRAPAGEQAAGPAQPGPRHVGEPVR